MLICFPDDRAGNKGGRLDPNNPSLYWFEAEIIKIVKTGAKFRYVVDNAWEHIVRCRPTNQNINFNLNFNFT